MATSITAPNVPIRTEDLCVGITELLIQFTGGNGIKYETMSFLTLPPKDVFMILVMVPIISWPI
jgi:uncharacterized membrane protein